MKKISKKVFDYTYLENQLGYVFHNKSILKNALTTKACYIEKNQIGDREIKSNERLEHFGDAILKFLMTEYLFYHYSDADEAELSSLRQDFESNSFLCEIAKKYDVDKFILKSKNELVNDKIDHTNMNADAIEALVAAIYIDSEKNIETTKKFVFDKIMSSK